MLDAYRRTRQAWMLGIERRQSQGSAEPTAGEPKQRRSAARAESRRPTAWPQPRSRHRDAAPREKSARLEAGKGFASQAGQGIGRPRPRSPQLTNALKRRVASRYSIR